MNPSKKYSCRVIQNGSAWTAEVVRRVTSKRSLVTKSQDGLATEAEALAWGEKEVNALLKSTNTKEMSKRRAKKK